MLDKLRQFNSYIQHFNGCTPNPATEKLPLLGSPLPVWCITLIYLILVLGVGPQFMKNRHAYNVRLYLLAYNLFQVVINFYLHYQTCRLIFKHKAYDWGCSETLAQYHPQKASEVHIFFWYYILKYIDYFDTVFFILRKNFKQISFLHVYHHAILVNSSYFYLRFYGSGGQMISVILLNTIIHCLMYIYYFIAALGLGRNLIWWKMNLTRLQLLQFILVFLHHLYPLVFRPSCVPKYRIIYGLIQSIIMTLLFANFYRRAYMRPEKKYYGSLKSD